MSSRVTRPRRWSRRANKRFNTCPTNERETHEEQISGSTLVLQTSGKYTKGKYALQHLSYQCAETNTNSLRRVCMSRAVFKTLSNQPRTEYRTVGDIKNRLNFWPAENYFKRLAAKRVQKPRNVSHLPTSIIACSFTRMWWHSLYVIASSDFDCVWRSCHVVRASKQESDTAPSILSGKLRTDTTSKKIRWWRNKMRNLRKSAYLQGNGNPRNHQMFFSVLRKDV